MMEDICHILNNGEVPELFSNEEKAKAVEEMELTNQSAQGKGGQGDVKATAEKAEVKEVKDMKSESLNTRFETFLRQCK